MKKKLLCIVAAATGSILFCTGVFAGSTLEKITASKDLGVVTKVDNVNKKFVSGKTTLYPILYGNKYYVPVEEFSRAAKVTYLYNAKNKTMYIGKRDGRVALPDIKDRNLYYCAQFVKDKAQLVSNGKAGDFGLEIKTISSAESRVSFELNNQFKKLTLSSVPLASGDEIIWNFRDESDAVIKTFTAKGTETLNNVEVDVTGVKTLFISAKGHKGDAKAILKDLYLTAK